MWIIPALLIRQPVAPYSLSADAMATPALGIGSAVRDGEDIWPTTSQRSEKSTNQIVEITKKSEQEVSEHTADVRRNKD
tara:strand:- start:488 stop:724 length:237 start_codon:yes stop_codon:yes gene_type:complete